MRKVMLTAEECYQKAVVCCKKGHYKDCLVYLNQALAINPQHRRALINITSTKSFLGKYKEAVEDGTKGLQFYPEEVMLYNNRGVAREGLGDLKGALADYDKAIQIKPHFALAYRNRSEIKFKLEDFYGAMKDCNAALKLKPYPLLAYEVYTLRAITKARIGDYHGALKDFDKAGEFKPQDSCPSQPFKLLKLHFIKLDIPLQKSAPQARKKISFDENIHTDVKENRELVKEDFVNVILNLQLPSETYLRLRVLQKFGYKYTETAKALGIPLTTLCSSVDKVVDKLKKLIPSS